MNITAEPPYTRIAPVYDDVMRGVDYENWSDYIDEIIQEHHIDARSILELGCGTGGHALKLEELECYDILATDRSAEMIECARQKASKMESAVRFEVADFLNYRLNQTFDAALLVFDSINYVQDIEQLPLLFISTEKHLNPNGIFIFDFTTPGFSDRVAESLNEYNPRRVGNFRYRRESRWDAEQRIHTNRFIIDELHPESGQVLHTYEETHRQRIHSPEEIEKAIAASGLKVEARYSDFDFSDVTESTDRITMVLRKCRNNR